MADKVYKRLDNDQLIFLVQYLFTKLKTSPLAKNTTYTLGKSEGMIQLKDNNGTVVGSVTDSDHTYLPVTDTDNGLMTSAMKKKLDGVQENASAVSYTPSLQEGTVIGTITVNGNSEVLYAPQDTNTTYTLTQDKDDKHILIFTPSNGTEVRITIPDNDHVYSAATSESDGLMTASDKTKLSAISNNADSVNFSGLYSSATGTSIGTLNISGTDKTIYVPKDTNTTYTLTQDSTDGHKIIFTSSANNQPVEIIIPDSDTTYGNVTDTTSGLMTADQKKKLDKIAAEANKTVVDSALSSTSTNPVQNKVINTALDNKASTSSVTALEERINNLTYSDIGGTNPASGQIGAGILSIKKNDTLIDTFSANATTNKEINIAVPTATSELNNDSGFQTATQVEALIATKISQANHLKRNIVTVLPTTEIDENSIYMVQDKTETSNVYSEWMYINNAWERIGDTSTDVSGYVKSSEMVVLTNDEITTAVDNAYVAVFGE